MAYGSGANWAGTDGSEQSAAANWSTDTSGSELESPALAEFTIQAHATPPQVAEAMETAWNAAHPNEPVTRNGATVRWPAGTDITNMSFTVDDGPNNEVPGLGNAVPVFGGLTVKNIA